MLEQRHGNRTLNAAFKLLCRQACIPCVFFMSFVARSSAAACIVRCCAELLLRGGMTASFVRAGFYQYFARR